MTMAAAEPLLSLILADGSNSNPSNALLGSNQKANYNALILDSGATDHIIFDVNDFSRHSPLDELVLPILMVSSLQ